jgi:SAM-dependent methyltransferase
MDGQHFSHGTSYAYSAPEWPEFYDLWVESLSGPGPYEDARIFWNALRDIIAAHRESKFSPSNIPDGKEVITVVDLGTGTGRVINGLVAAMVAESQAEAKAEEGESSRVIIRLVDVDHSKAMLKRARKRFDEVWSGKEGLLEGKVIGPHWMRASAARFVTEYGNVHEETQ